MEFSMYNMVYLIMNIFGTYIVYKFMRVFFDAKTVNRRREFLSYVAFYLCISALYIFINIPILMLVSNITGYILISFNYRATLKQRLVSVVFIYIILVLCESSVVLLSGYINPAIFIENYYSSVLGIICINILNYVVVLLIKNFSNVKRGISVPTLYWISILLIPASSVYIMVSIFSSRGLSRLQILMSVIFLLVTNFVAFYLYDSIIDKMEDKLSKMMLQQQNLYYERQFDLMQSSLATTRAVRHDLVNHLYIVKSLADNNEKEKLDEYISGLIVKSKGEKEYSRTGNLIIDSILNFKLQEAEQRGIKTILDLNVPVELEITSLDMTIVLGNLLDNAINAVSNLDEEERIIHINIKFDRGRLIINTKNNFAGEIIYDRNQIVSSKEDKENHGIGLSNVRRIIEKYQGMFDIEHSKNIFNVTTLMYVTK